MKKFYSMLAGAALLLLATSCYEDKGNYTYTDVETIEITIPSGLTAMASAEYISFDPKIVSSIKGEISANDPDYEFTCQVQNSWQDEFGVTHRYRDMNPDKTKAVNYFAALPSGSYTMWYKVKNLKTEVEYSAQGSFSLISSTYEGYMVLSNTGADKKVRIDMIGQNSAGEEIVAKDVAASSTTPETHNAHQILFAGFYMSQYSNADAIYLLTGDGAFKLNNTTLMYTEADNLANLAEVIGSSAGAPAFMEQMYSVRAIVDDNGDARGIHSTYAGSPFEDPMNTDKVGNAPTYKVAPYFGVCLERPIRYYSYCLFYDITNKRFMLWNYSSGSANNHLLIAPAAKDGDVFSYETGMDYVAMKSTMFSGGMCYTVLQDPSTSKRAVYGVNLASGTYHAEALYDAIETPDFHSADAYEFHSQYPYMYYAKGNKLYECGLTSGKLLEQIELPADEKVTMLKFNLLHTFNWNYLRTQSLRDDQYNLIVASTTGKEDGGVVRIYTIDPAGKLTLKKEYKGFGEDIVDVTYRERRTNAN